MKSAKLSRAGWLWLLIGTAVCLIGAATYVILFSPFGGPSVFTLDQNFLRQIPISFLQGTFAPLYLVAAIWLIVLIVSVIFFIRSGIAYKAEHAAPMFARNGFFGLYDKVRYYDYKGVAKKRAKAAKKKAKAWAKKAKKNAKVWSTRSKATLFRFGENVKNGTAVATKKAKYAKQAYLSSDKAMKATLITLGCAVPLTASFLLGEKASKNPKKLFAKKAK